MSIGSYIGTPIGAEEFTVELFEPATHKQWDDPRQTIARRAIVGAFIATMSAGLFAPPLQFSSPTVDKYLTALSEPVRLDLRKGLAAPRQPFLAFQLTNSQQPEDVNEAKWHQPWSEPKRFKPLLLPGSHQFLAFQNPQSALFESVCWIQPFSEPKRFKPGLGVHLQRDFTTDPANTLLAGFRMAWYAPFSEPKRFLKGLAPQLQRVTTMEQTFQPPTNRLIQWFLPLSEPVRLPKGMKAWLQMTTAMPHRHLPTPNITLVMRAHEINTDEITVVYSTQSIGGGAVASARVSITEADDSSAVISTRES